MKYILSTMTTSVSYAFFTHAGDLPVMRDKVTVKGGAGLPSANSGYGEKSEDGEGMPIWTAEGFITPVSEEKYALLKDHKLFKDHLAKGYLKVLNTDISGNHKAVKEHVRDMEKRDGFAQLTPDSVKQYAKGIKISTATIDSDIQFRQ